MRVSKMSKEYLEALERIIENRIIDIEGIERSDGTSYEKDIETIETALKRLEQIDNSKPSEALECLEILYNMIDGGWDRRDKIDNTYNTIKQTLTNQLPKEVVLQIIDEEFEKHKTDVFDMYNFYIALKDRIGDIKND